MGNKAVIKANGNDNKAVYLHWNGGRDSIEAFLKYCELRGFSGFDSDYGIARFCQVVGNFFGADGSSLGVVDYVASCGDNGVYVVEGWEIVDRIDFNGVEQNSYDLQDMLLKIDESQPLKQQLGDYLKTNEVPTNTVAIGDTVYLMKFDGKVEKCKVVGFGEDTFVNGTEVLGLPYVDKYLNNGVYSENINNYIRSENVRLVVNDIEKAKI